jgi:hypothetical protein
MKVVKIIVKSVAVIAFLLFVLGYIYSGGETMISGLYSIYGLLLIGLFMLDQVDEKSKTPGIAEKSPIPTYLSALMIIGLIVVTGLFHKTISTLHVSFSFILFNAFIMASLFYSLFSTAVSPHITLFILVWVISIVVMLYTQTTDGFAGISL